MPFVPDSSVRFSASIKNASSVLADPTTISLQIFDSGNAQSASYLQGTDAELVKDGTGLYHADYVIPSTGSLGLWAWKWKSTGSHAGAESGTFLVSPSR